VRYIGRIYGVAYGEGVCVQRKRRGRVFATVGEDGDSTVLIVGHGATNDFVLYALCGEKAHPTGRYSSDAAESLSPPPHVSLTTLTKNNEGMWEVEGYGVPTVCNPFKTGCVALSYSDNPGVNGVSDRGVHGR
jgi:hypothetical protein